MNEEYHKKIEQFLDTNKQIGIFILRIFIGSRLLYGVIDNVLSWERMIEFSIFLLFRRPKTLTPL